MSLIKNQLKKVVTKDTKNKVAVNARELWKFLQVKTPYNKWIVRMINQYGLIKGVDYSVLSMDKNVHGQDGLFTATKKVVLSLECAKELCMVQKTKRSKQARRYFINVEAKYRNVESNPLALINNMPKSQIFLEASKYAKRAETYKPLATNFKKMIDSNGTVAISVIASHFGLSARAMNQLLKKWNIQYKQGDHWMLRKRYLGKRYAKLIPYLLPNGQSVDNLRWMFKGYLFIRKVMSNHGYYPKDDNKINGLIPE